jgi:SAM-dependent methyltransferase
MSDRAGHVDYDAELQLHNEVLRRTYNIRREDRVLDIGCGTGQTTRDAGRMAVAGSAIGVDISAQMIERARKISKAEGLSNVCFEQGDAQVHPFPSGHFDIAISRFGTMFFADPIAAFANIARALRPGGRLVMMVWQPHDRNEWFTSIQRSLANDEATLDLPSGTPDPFSLGDPATVQRILEEAGFAGAIFTDVQKPVYYGRDAGAALEFVRAFSYTDDALKRLDPSSAERAFERLRRTLAAHDRGQGVWLEASAWIVTARRR